MQVGDAFEVSHDPHDPWLHVRLLHPGIDVYVNKDTGRSRFSSHLAWLSPSTCACLLREVFCARTAPDAGGGDGDEDPERHFFLHAIQWITAATR